MAEIKVFDSKGTATSPIEAPQKLSEANASKGLIHQVVIAQLAAKRQGTASTKTRSEVAGSGAKIRRQRGTGRSRQGDKRVPHARGGGIAHGVKPRSYAQATPRKMRQRAFATALNSRLQNELIGIVDGDLEEAKTKHFVSLLNELGLTGKKVLFLADISQEDYHRSARNLPRVKVRTVTQTSIVDVLDSDYILCTQAAWEQLSARVGS